VLSVSLVLLHHRSGIEVPNDDCVQGKMVVWSVVVVVLCAVIIQVKLTGGNSDVDAVRRMKY
jgi:hypothetical protein